MDALPFFLALKPIIHQTSAGNLHNSALYIQRGEIKIGCHGESNAQDDSRSVRWCCFRKTVATLIDDEGLSARIGADHLGHAKVSMTQNVYMTRGRVHAQVVELLDRTVAASDAVISDE